jgi:hypothetical protein
MPIKKFRSVEEMTPAPGPIDRAGNLRSAFELSRLCFGLGGTKPRAGVRKYRSIEEANADRARWERTPNR